MPLFLIVEMKRISENGKLAFMLVQKLRQPPKIRVQNGIAAGNIKIWSTVVNLAKIQTVAECLFYLFPCHGNKTSMFTWWINIAMFAPLVTFVSYVPLKTKMFHWIYISFIKKYWLYFKEQICNSLKLMLTHYVNNTINNILCQ